LKKSTLLLVKNMRDLSEMGEKSFMESAEEWRVRDPKWSKTNENIAKIFGYHRWSYELILDEEKGQKQQLGSGKGRQKKEVAPI
jgi:hypothetical protein